MKISFSIPDNHKDIELIIALIKRFGISPSIEVTTDTDIPEHHKQLVLERIESASDNDYVSWEEIKKNIKLD